MAEDLLGREREREVIERLVSRAVAGESACLVLRGDAGIGKSALLSLALRPSGSVTVLTVTGVEAESDLAFAGLFGLLRSVLEFLGELPATQAAALEGALGLAPSADPDRFLVSAAALGLIAAASEHRPVVCVIDDAQWLDRPSADALVFAARRLRAERVAMLFAAREDEGQRLEAQGVPDLRVSGLDAEIAARLLAEHAAGAAPAVRARLVAEAQGNPLALLELPGALSEEQLAGRAPLPEAMPLTPRLAGVFRQRIDRLPGAAQDALLVAAIDGTGELGVVLRALGELALGADALDSAERAGLIRTDRAGIEFRHPLVRATVHDRATLSERQRAHATLAKVLAGDEHVDRRVWHQATATVSGDEEVAVALEASARRAQLRAGHASAATAYERAAELTGDQKRRAPRLKDEYGLGHGHAMAIVATIKKHAGPEASVDEKIARHFAGKKSGWLAVYERLVKEIRSFGPDTDVAPAASYLNFRKAGKKFAIVQVTTDRLDVGLKLKGVAAADRLESAGSWNAMVTHRVRIDRPEEVDGELLGWLGQAYARA